MDTDRHSAYADPHPIMRWFVEIGSLRASVPPRERHCVEAQAWQDALRRVREHEGHDLRLGNFSIELRGDAVRAADPVTQSLYRLWPAPADANATLGGAPSRMSTSPLGSAPPMSQPAPSTERASSLDAPRSQRPSTLTPKIRTSVSFPPGVRVVTAREEAVTDKTRLHYREYAFAVPEGTLEEEAESFLRARLREVRQQMQTVEGARLVNLAVFDHAFLDRPQRPPLVAMVWKDWRGDPEVLYPARPGGSIPAPSLGDADPPSKKAPTAPAIPKGPRVPSGLELVPQSGPISAPPMTPPPSTEFVLSEPPPPVQESPSSPSLRRPSRPSATFDLAPAVSPSTHPAPGDSLGAAVVYHAERASQPKIQAVAQPIPVSEAPATIREPSPISALPQQPVSAPSAPPATIASPAPLDLQFVDPKSGPLPPVQERRSSAPKKRGDEFATDLFEVMHDLHFAQDVEHGAEFVLELALEKLRSDLGIVQLYDINKREFVVVSSHGPGAATAHWHRTSERDPLIRELVRKRVPVLLKATDDRIREGRWAKLGGAPRLILSCFVELNGRSLGMLEVGAPHDGVYEEGDMHGMAYICSHFAEFLGMRGVVLSAEPTVP